MTLFSRLFVFLLCALTSFTAFAATARSVYKAHCSACHGKQLEGGMAGSLVDDQWRTIDGSDTSIANVIRDGNSMVGMPAWRKVLSEAEIRGLVIHINEQRYAFTDRAADTPRDSLSFSAQGYTVQMETITRTHGRLWAVEPLPNGDLLMTQRDGVLWYFDGERNQAIANTPEVWEFGQGGLLDVALHPDYANNAWVYLAYTDTADGASGITTVVRGKIEQGKWVQQQRIFEMPERFHSGTRYHFGARMVFKEGYLYFGIGDRGAKDFAQKLGYPNGKIFRVHDDGRVPKDNPFVNQRNALPEIFSYGHRNPQGMALNPVTNTVWSSEHGPRGGDEVNSLDAGLNYGWPVITYGMNYSGTPMTHLTAKDGMEQPRHYWVPSIAIAGIDFYQGDLFPKWHGKLLVSGMKKEVLQLVDMDGDTVVGVSTLLKGQGRVRDVRVAADGSIYVVINQGSRDGRVVRLTPTTTPLAK